MLPKSCVKYTNTGWQQFASMKEKKRIFCSRSHAQEQVPCFWRAMKVAQAASKTTELISIDGGVEYGPELPEAA